MKARAYVVSSLNFIFPNWYQDMSLKQVYKLISQVQELVKQRATKIEYSRTYIPKKTDAQGNPLLNEEGE
jgi:antirestriction protein ArdC